MAQIQVQGIRNHINAQGKWMVFVIIFLIVFTAPIYSAEGTCSNVRTYPADTVDLDQLPEDSLLYKTVLDRIQFGYAGDDLTIFTLMPDDTVIGRAVRTDRSRLPVQASIEASLELLAWQKSRVSDKYLWNGEELVLYNALLWSAYKDSSGVSRWALILATKDEGLAGYVSWKLVKSIPDGPIKHYSKPPTNEDILTFLSSLSTIENHLFVQDSANINRDYDVPLEFLDGDVLDETWEAVIGEKPTKFFPNGK